MERESVNGARPKHRDVTSKKHEDIFKGLPCLPMEFEREPMYLKFMQPAKRYRSFKKWTNENNLSVIDLAKSGFFLECEDECIRCFCCGKGFRKWAPLHHPDVEHALYSPKCLYLEKVRGKAFIDEMKQFHAQGGHPTRKPQDSLSDELAEGLNYEVHCIDTEEKLRDENIALSKKTKCKLCTQKDVSCVTLCCNAIFYCYRCATGLTNCPKCCMSIKIRKIYLYATK